MAEYIDERSNSDAGKIFPGKCPAGFVPVNRICRLLTATSGLTVPNLNYLSKTSARVCSLNTPLTDSALFSSLPPRQRSALMSLSARIQRAFGLPTGIWACHL